jgi:hypothetical protein
MNSSTPTPTDRVEKSLLVACIVLVTFAGHCDQHKRPDPSVRLEEMRQRSVTEDPVVRGELPFDWLVSNPQNAGSPPDAEEVAEFAEMFQNTTAPKVVEEELLPGATRIVELQLAGPSGLAGSAEWIGTAATLKVTLSVNGSPLAIGTAFSTGTNRGGSILHAQTPVGGPATIAVTNTSKTKVKVRILLLATAL